MNREERKIYQYVLNRPYNAKKTESGPSKSQSYRAFELKRQQEKGLISDLREEVYFDLRVNGILITRYRADFVYNDKNGQQVVEDVKGFISPIFQIKQRLMEACFGIKVICTR